MRLLGYSAVVAFQYSHSIYDRRSLLAALMAMAVLLLACAGAFLWVNQRVDEVLEEQTVAAIAQQVALLDLIDRDSGRADLEQFIRTRIKVAGNTRLFLLSDPDGKTVVTNLPPFSRDMGLQGYWEILELPDGSVIRVHPVQLVDGAHLLVGESSDSQIDVRHSIVTAAAAASLAVLLIGMLTLLRFNRFVLDRIEGLAATARSIMQGQLTARAPVVRHVDAFGDLSRVFNDMLDQSEALVAGMRTVTNSLAHDLRTPLMRMRASIAAARAAGEDSVRDSHLEQAEGEARRAVQVFSALMDLARAESGLSRDSMELIDLEALVADVCELFEPLTAEKQQSLQLTHEPAQALAHRQVLFQALGNLIENAIRYAPANSRIDVSLTQVAGSAVISVRDHGAGIPPADRGKAVQPFVRLRVNDGAEGSGLGLAIAAAAARLHQGELRLEDANPGLRASIILRSPSPVS